MKITTEEYALLKVMAEDIVTSESYHPSYKRRLKGVNQETGVVYTTFYTKGTVSAVLAGMVRAIELGTNPAIDILVEPMYTQPTDKKTDQKPEVVDVFTAEALAKIPAGKPDSAMLNPSRVKMMGIGLVQELKDAISRKEGDAWVDENGRHWKFIDGKKRQQKKPKG